MSVTAWRLALAALLLAAWQSAGLFGDTTWISAPTLIAARLGALAAGNLALHLGTTLLEMAAGLSLGVPAGVCTGLLLSQMPTLASLLRPFIVVLYSVPLVTLAPVLILWFGLDLAPKIVLVGAVSFFLLFFSTFTGAQRIDPDLVGALRLMGATRAEIFRRVLAPASSAWIIGGLRLALPYAVIAATVGEMIASRRGLGFLLTEAAAQIDMTGLYAALIVLMSLGIAIAATTDALERRVLHWRAG